MIEELPYDIDNDELDDVEPVGDEAQLYEHVRVVVDKGQELSLIHISSAASCCSSSSTARK